MAKRRKIYLMYEYNENWIGGTYYIQNLILALNTLRRSKRPWMFIYTNDNNHFNDLKNLTKYPFLINTSIKKKKSLLETFGNKISRLLLRKNIFLDSDNNYDLVFHAAYNTTFDTNQKLLFWFPDFQEHYLPDFFTTEEIEFRKAYQTEIIKVAKYILFSSQSTKKDFNEIYPFTKLKQFVLPFATNTPKLKECNIRAERYNLPRHYFICCNQFWKHKNHNLIFKAVHLLKSQGHEVFVVFTGKEHDNRDPNYFSELTQTVSRLGLEENVRFLGFIKREDQLCLMKQALAVIQPSLFEGWSTVVEDAKSLGSKIIASQIEVHQEQLEKYGLSVLFSPVNENELAAAMIAIHEIDGIPPNYYKRNVKDFGKNFSMIIDTISKD